MSWTRLLLFLILLAADVSAQTIRASIYGRVLDASGSAVSGAPVKSYTHRH